MRCSKFLVTVVATAATVLAGPAVGHAAPRASTPVSSFGSTTSLAPSLIHASPSVQVNAAVGGTITCYTNFQDAHESSHVPATVNVVATVNCLFDDGLPAPVTSLTLRVQLFYGTYPNGVLESEGDFANEGQSSLSGNAAAPCVPGYYYGYGYMTVVFPPNYAPPTGAAQGGSGRPAVLITCT